jgi:hypothetical protein
MAPGQVQQNQQNPTTPSVVAAPGSTVVVQPAQPGTNPANGGLIVAAPGSTVVVQPTQPAQTAAKTNPTTANTFSSQDQLSVVYTLVQRAKGIAPPVKKGTPELPAKGPTAKEPTAKKLPVLVRAGAIDALGLIGGDTTVIEAIVRGLTQVLDQEYPIDKMDWDDENSEFICYHVVQALGKLGWGAKSSLAHLQLLRGQNVILDAAIDNAVNAIKTGPKPPQPPQQPAPQGSGMTMNPGTTP